MIPGHRCSLLLFLLVMTVGLSHCDFFIHKR